MFKFYKFIFLILLSTLLTSCFNNSNFQEIEEKENIRMANASSIYNKELKSLLKTNIDQYFQNHISTTSQYIEEKASENDFNLTKEIEDNILRYLQKRFETKASLDFHKKFLKNLSLKFKEFYISIDIENLSLSENTLDSYEEDKIVELINRYFADNQNDIENLFQERLEQILISYFQQNNLLMATQSTTPQSSIFTSIQRSADFNKKMNVYFKDFNAYNYEEKETMARSFKDKLSITSVFDIDNQKFYKNSPVFDNGNLVDIDSQENEFYLPTTSISDNYFYTTIDHDLLLFIHENYSNETYTYILDEDGYINTIDAFDYLENITDVVSLNIDNDEFDEIIIAKGAPSNSITIYDDRSSNFNKLASFNFKRTLFNERGVVRVDAGDIDGDGYDEFSAVFYDEEAKDFKANLKMWNFDMQTYHLIKRLDYNFSEKTPVDVTFADLEEVDKIELFAVQVSPKLESSQKGYHQPKQISSDDYCQYFVESTNELFVYKFNTNSSVEQRKIKIKNYTYDKKYNTDGEIGGTDDGVRCIVGGCSCVDDFKATPYHLYLPFKFDSPCKKDDPICYQTKHKYHQSIPPKKIWKPIYITPYYEELDKPAILDIDGLKYNFTKSDSLTTIEPAKNYKDGKHMHTYNGKTNYYIPVTSNYTGNNHIRAFYTKMIEGQRFYPKSPFTKNVFSIINNDINLKPHVFRHLSRRSDSFKPYFSLSSPSRILKFEEHKVLYTDPIFSYIILTPPPVSKIGLEDGRYFNGATMTYSLGSCKSEETSDKVSNGILYGMSVSFGIGADAIVAKGELVNTIGFKSVQSSTNINALKEESCIERSSSLKSNEDDVVYYFSSIIDNFSYVVVKDLTDPYYTYDENSTHNKKIYINRRRKDNSFAYERQVSLKTLYKELDENNISYEFDLRDLIKHRKNDISTYFTQSDIRDIIDSRANQNLSDVLSVKYSPNYDYTNLWYSSNNILIPENGGYDGKFEFSSSITNGTSKDSELEVSYKVEMKFQEAAAIEGLEGEAGWHHTHEHEKTTENSKSNSYTISLEEKVDNLNYTHIGIFSYLTKPLTSIDCHLKDIPINREDYENYDPDELAYCIPPILVIDYFLTNNSINN